MQERSLSPETPSVRADQIAEATRALFLRYGYRRTSVDDIAREAGVAKATLYLHFAGKEDMFRAMIARFWAVVNDRCDAAEALAAPIDQRLVALLLANYGTALEWFGDASHISELKAFAAEHPIAEQDDAVPAYRERIRRLLVAADAAGEIDLFATGVPLAGIVRILIYAATGAKRARRNASGGLPEEIEAAVRLILAGALRAAR
jgi:AcrR family transcriptional regulator